MRSISWASRRSSAEAAAGQFAADLDRLYQQQFRPLYRYLDRTLGDPHLAGDIAQEAFVRLFERGAMPDSPVAWLITVANNLLRDDRRRTGRRLRLLRHSADDFPRAAPAPEPGLAVERAERRENVQAALEQLALRDRTILLLRHSGYSYREIAVALGITETSVGTILLRAGAQFRKKFQELHGEPD